MKIEKIVLKLIPERIKRLIKEAIWQVLRERTSLTPQNITDLEVELKQLEYVLKRETTVWLPPPKHLQFRVVGSYVPEFIESGYKTFERFDQVVHSAAGRDLRSFEKILDFGCGCGRIIRGFRYYLPSNHLYGTDIDSEAIAWLKENGKGMGEFSTNPHMPPTAYEDNLFDLIYSVSIFTHLPEDMQFAWLGELRRITKPGGYLILTTHGEKHYSRLPAQSLKIMKAKGFYYNPEDDVATDGLPSFYRVAYHSPEYIRREWLKYFDIVNVLEMGLEDHQDIILLRKPV
jgi:SAM-dependent methyltransferase